jgi:DNA-binding CsgD family transcriptional regulator
LAITSSEIFRRGVTHTERAAHRGDGGGRSSNRDIAQALFVTLRTVEMHLSNAFRKLQISSRTQLPSALAAEDRELVTAADSRTASGLA